MSIIPLGDVNMTSINQDNHKSTNGGEMGKSSNGLPRTIMPALPVKMPPLPFKKPEDKSSKTQTNGSEMEIAKDKKLVMVS